MEINKYYFLFLLAAIILFSPMVIGQDGLKSHCGDLSLEARIQVHLPELEMVNHYFKNYAPTPIDYSEIAMEIFYDFYTDAAQQKLYMDQNSFPCEWLRLCDEEVLLLGYYDQLLYLNVISYLENNFCYSNSEIASFISELENLEGLLSTNAEWTRLLLIEYLRITVDKNYTKLEMFRDFTGFCEPEVYYQSVVVNGTTDSLPMEFNRTQQGLGLLESSKRLAELSTCIQSWNYADSRGPAGSTPALGERHFSRNNISLIIYPNPSTGSEFTIVYTLDVPGHISLELYDVGGKFISTIYQGDSEHGRNTMPVDLSANNLNRNTVYYCILKTDTGIKVSKVILR